MNWKLLLAGFCLSLAACGGSRETEISVVSFNVRLDSPQDGEDRWENRRQAAAEMIRRERPTLVGLQEAQPHQLGFLAASCPDYAWYGLGRESGKIPSETGEYPSEETMAVMWRKSDVELLDRGTFWLSETPDSVSKGWDAYCNRTCTWGLFRCKDSGRKFYFFNTHLDHIGQTARTESMKLIAARLGGIDVEGVPTFLTADFNSRTTDACFAPLHACMADARTEAPLTDDKPSWNGYGRKSTPNWLDHIFFAGEGCRAVEFRTLTDDYGAPYISDHYPVLARFRLTD